MLLFKVLCVTGLFFFFLLKKLIPEMQKLFSSKNESNVLKLWPLFVKLLGKVRHACDPATHGLSFLSTEEMFDAGKSELGCFCFSCSTKEVPS